MLGQILSLTGCATCGAVELDGVDEDAGLFIRQTSWPLGNRGFEFAAIQMGLTYRPTRRGEQHSRWQRHSRWHRFMSYGMQA